MNSGQSFTTLHSLGWLFNWTFEKNCVYLKKGPQFRAHNNSMHITLNIRGFITTYFRKNRFQYSEKLTKRIVIVSSKQIYNGGKDCAENNSFSSQVRSETWSMIMRWRKNLSLWIHPQFRLSECTNPSFRACAVLTYKFPAIFCQNIDQRRSFEVSILAIDDFLSCFFLHPGIKRKILMDYDRSGPHGSPSSVLHDERNINIFPMLKFLADSL